MRSCPYCGDQAVYSPTSGHLYHGREYGPVWQCLPCRAWVGCHPAQKGDKGGPLRPLGRLADAELRRAKIDAHAAFDRLWEAKMRRDGCSKGFARGSGYAWLATQMGMTRKECHIGEMDVTQCRRVVEICTNLPKIKGGEV